MTKAISRHLAYTPSSDKPKMLQVWMVQDTAHKSDRDLTPSSLPRQQQGQIPAVYQMQLAQ